MNVIPSATQRWIITPLKKSLVFLLLGLILNYFTLCLSKGFTTSYDISSWFVLVIVRAIISLLLGILYLFIIPFTDWNLFVLSIKNSVIVFPVIGFLYGITESTKSRNPNRFNPTIFLLIYIFIFLMIYWQFTIRDGTISLISFIIESSVFMPLSIALVSIWLIANLIMKIKD